MDDEIFQRFVAERNLSKRSINAYNSALKDYCKFNKMSLQELYDEADEEEENRVRANKRKISSRLLKYRTYKINQGSAVQTIKGYFSSVKTFYKHNGIEIPYIPPVILNEDFHERFDHIPTIEHIKQALEDTKNTRHKALILFMASSGTAINETLNITVGDFIKATSDYHDNSTKLKDVLEKLKGQKDIIPIFDMVRAKTNHPYYTCCSHEATQMILNFLRKNDRFKKEDKLFNLTPKAVVKAFADINDRHGWGRVGKRRFFHSHALRKFNATAIEEEKLANTIQGRKEDSVTESYFKKDPKRIRERYKKHLDKLTVNKTYVNVINTEGYEKLKAELEEKTKIVEEQSKMINDLKGGFKTLQDDVEKLKNPDKYYSSVDIIEEVVKESPEMTPLKTTLVLEKINNDRKDIRSEGKDKSYVRELISYADNTLKLNPNHFTPDEIEKIETDNEVIRLFNRFHFKTLDTIHIYLEEKGIKLNEKQSSDLVDMLHHYAEEVFYYEDEKIDMEYIDLLITKVVNNDKELYKELYTSPYNPKMNKNQQYLKNRNKKLSQ